MKGVLFEFKSLKVKVKLILAQQRDQKERKKKNNTSGYCDVQFSKRVLTVHNISPIDAAAAMKKYVFYVVTPKPERTE